jgi:hypothetical protein
VRVHEALAAKGLLPAQHLVDTGYVDAGILVETRQRFAVGKGRRTGLHVGDHARPIRVATLG